MPLLNQKLGGFASCYFKALWGLVGGGLRRKNPEIFTTPRLDSPIGNFAASYSKACRTACVTAAGAVKSSHGLQTAWPLRVRRAKQRPAPQGREPRTPRPRAASPTALLGTTVGLSCGVPPFRGRRGGSRRGARNQPAAAAPLRIRAARAAPGLASAREPCLARGRGKAWRQTIYQRVR